MIRHRAALRLIDADWGFIVVSGGKRGLILAVTHGGTTLHIPVSVEEAHAAAADLTAVLAAAGEQEPE